MTDTQAKWAVITIIALVDVAWAWRSGVMLTGIPWLLVLELSIWAACAWRGACPRIANAFLTLAQVNGALGAVGLFTYLSIRAGTPLADTRLAAIDRSLGFDWPAVFAWVQGAPSLHAALAISYWSLFAQLPGAVVLLAVTRRFDRSAEFVSLFIATLIACAAVSAFFPAEAAWSYYGVSDVANAYHLADFNALRDGSMQEIAVDRMTGLITFPSFHAALALLFIYATRGIPWLFPAALVLNIGMIAATPVIGGHYLVDVIAGLALVPVAIAVLHPLASLPPRSRNDALAAQSCR
jgi:hypothetical protein